MLCVYPRCVLPPRQHARMPPTAASSTWGLVTIGSVSLYISNSQPTPMHAGKVEVQAIEFPKLELAAGEFNPRKRKCEHGVRFEFGIHIFCAWLERDPSRALA
jgi:hypothetical protein